MIDCEYQNQWLKDDIILSERAGSSNMKNQDFVIVEVVYGQAKANILKAHLESEGIPVFLQYESLAGVYGISVDGLGKIKIKVPAECVDDAKQILEQTHEDPTPDEK